jgi:hypothetical protein
MHGSFLHRVQVAELHQQIKQLAENAAPQADLAAVLTALASKADKSELSSVTGGQSDTLQQLQAAVQRLTRDVSGKADAESVATVHAALQQKADGAALQAAAQAASAQSAELHTIQQVLQAVQDKVQAVSATLQTSQGTVAAADDVAALKAQLGELRTCAASRSDVATVEVR